MNVISIHTESPKFLNTTDQDTKKERLVKQVTGTLVWSAASLALLVHFLIVSLFAFFVKTYHFFTSKDYATILQDLYVDTTLVYAYFAGEALIKGITNIFLNFFDDQTRKETNGKIEKIIESLYHSPATKAVRNIHVDGIKEDTVQLNAMGLMKFGMFRTQNFITDCKEKIRPFFNSWFPSLAEDATVNFKKKK